MPSRSILRVILFLTMAVFGFALFTQHVWNMPPCPWCVLQRMICVGIVIAALPGAVWSRRGVRRFSAFLTAVFSMAGMAAAAWQHFVASVSVSCNLTLADRIVSWSGLDNWLPDVFAPFASCAEATATLFGIPYPLGTLALFGLLTLLALWALFRRA